MMRRWVSSARKLRRLPSPKRRLFVVATLLMLAIKLALTLLPYRKLSGLVDRLGRAVRRPRYAPAASPERIAWAVARAGCFVPKATCLTQALAAKVLLERSGHPAQVRVGFGRSEDARLIAHAWVESDGQVVLGGLDLTRYTPLLGLDAIQSRAVEAAADR
jgi:Transglutaminase-like superfamily